MLISHRHRFIFLKTRKTAGTSIELSLSRVMGPDDVITPVSPKDEKIRAEFGVEPRNWRGRFNPFRAALSGSPRELLHSLRDFVKGRRYRNHEPGFRVRARVDPAIWNSCFKFCFERNPWDKCVSHYFWMRHRRGDTGQTFEEYIRARDFPVDRHRYLERGRLLVDFVGRFENLMEDLEAACRLAGIPFDGWLPRAKSGIRGPGSRHYPDLVDDHAREVIAAAFAPEIRLLGYRFEERGRPPTLRREDLEPGSRRVLAADG
jgi:hypothetical protein